MSRAEVIAIIQPNRKAGVEIRAWGDISNTIIAMIGSGLIETPTASGSNSPMTLNMMIFL